MWRRSSLLILKAPRAKVKTTHTSPLTPKVSITLRKQNNDGLLMEAMTQSNSSSASDLAQDLIMFPAVTEPRRSRRHRS